MSGMMRGHCRGKIAGGLGRHGLATSVGQHEQRCLPGPASPPGAMESSRQLLCLISLHRSPLGMGTSRCQ